MALEADEVSRGEDEAIALRTGKVLPCSWENQGVSSFSGAFHGRDSKHFLNIKPHDTTARQVGVIVELGKPRHRLAKRLETWATPLFRSRAGNQTQGSRLQSSAVQ